MHTPHPHHKVIFRPKISRKTSKMNLVYLLRKFPKFTLYLVVVILFQAFYSVLITTHTANTTRRFLNLSAIPQFFRGNDMNISTTTTPTTTTTHLSSTTTVSPAIKYNSTNRDFVLLLDNLCPRRNQKLKLEGLVDCKCPPTDLRNRVNVKAIVRDVPITKMVYMFPRIQPGGTFIPHCNPIQRVAIIVPMRDREAHLRMFLHYMHPFLQRQSITYTIFVAEQVPGGPFNKARVMNSGFDVVSSKFGPFDCYIFNDVDMFPEDDRNIYACAPGVRHFGSHVSKFNYKLPYQGLFGGAIGMSADQFRMANGFSNTYVGWGGEDDDMYRRVRSKRLPVVRFPLISYYLMLKHGRDKGNPSNPNRGKAWRWMKTREYETEGLNTVTYNLVRLEKLPMYTRILLSFKIKKPKPPAKVPPPAKKPPAKTPATSDKKTKDTKAKQ